MKQTMALNKNVTPQDLTDICFEDQKVITTDLLAMLYETEPRRVTENFNRNIDRFTAGQHYYKLDGPALKEFKALYADSVVVDIAKNTSHLFIWTKRGIARHAKILDSDRAWDVFDKLEAHYFQPKSNMIQLDPSKNQPEILQLAADLSRQVKEKENLIKEQEPYVMIANEFLVVSDSWKLGKGKAVNPRGQQSEFNLPQTCLEALKQLLESEEANANLQQCNLQLEYKIEED